MSINKNEHKIAFKALFMDMLKNATPGAFITDITLKELCSAHSLSLNTQDIQTCIRQLEPLLGRNYQIRAIRKYKEGYKIAAGQDQYYKASEEGGNKMKSVLKKTGERLGYVDLNKLPVELKMTAVSKKNAIDALLSIAQGVMSSHKLETRDVSVISSAFNELKAIEQLKKGSF